MPFFCHILIDDRSLWVIDRCLPCLGSADAIGPLARLVAGVGRHHAAEQPQECLADPSEAAIDPAAQHLMVLRPEAVCIWFVHRLAPQVRVPVLGS